MSKKILVTGANGYIGSHLSAELIAQGFDVVLTGRQNESVIGHSNYYQIDLSKDNLAIEILQNLDVVFFCAGKIGVAQEGFDNPAEFINGNELALVNFLSQLKDQPKKPRIVFPSTRLLYQGLQGGVVTEDSPKDPKTVYAVSKLACEQYLEAFSRCYNIDYTTFRISLPYGSVFDLNRVSYGILAYLISRAEGGCDLTVFGDGSQKRSLIHIKDIVNILILGGMSDATKNEVYNIGGPDVLTLKEIISEIADTFRVGCLHAPWPRLSEIVESGNTVFDSSKIIETLHYQYSYNFKDWLKCRKHS